MRKSNASIDSIIALLEAEKDAGGGGAPPTPPPLNNGGDDGKFPDMEARVAKLESDAAYLVKQVDRLADIPREVGEIKAKVEALPSKDWVSGMMRNWMLGVAAFLTLVTVGVKFLNLG